MLRNLSGIRVLFGIPLLLAILVVAAACAAAETPTPIVIEKEVIREIEVPVIVEKEVPVEVVKEVVVKEQVVVIVEVTPTPRPSQDPTKQLFWEGAPPTKFNEAPELAEMVKQGKLPPVEQRLPGTPLVIDPPDDIGKYGGVYRWLGNIEHGAVDPTHLILDPTYGLTRLSRERGRVLPNVAKSWDITNGGRTYTFHLRKGMKWSDGVPFTAQDFEFAWKALISNPNVNPTFPRQYVFKDERVTSERVDDYTIRYKFTEPNPVFALTAIRRPHYQCFVTRPDSCVSNAYAPKHVFDYSPTTTTPEDLEKAAKDAGFDDWLHMFTKKASWQGGGPTIGWMMAKEPLAGRTLWRTERNPYYWVVDSAGNQLPYVDEAAGQGFASIEIRDLHAMAGEGHAYTSGISGAKTTLFLLNQQKGGYRVVLRPSDRTWSLFFNITHGAPGTSGDSEVGKWLRNIDFRRAISLAIDGEEINAIVYNGLATVRSPAPPPTSPTYPGEEYEKMNARFDLDEANRLLDSIGLDEKDGEGFRLRTDGGGRLMILMHHQRGAPGDVAELIDEQLSKVGIEVSIKDVGAAGYPEDWNEMHTMVFRISDAFTYGYTCGPMFGGYIGNFSCEAVNQWYRTGGEVGLDPYAVEWLKPAAELIDLDIQGKELSLEDRAPLGRQIIKIG